MATTATATTTQQQQHPKQATEATTRLPQSSPSAANPQMPCTNTNTNTNANNKSSNNSNELYYRMASKDIEFALAYAEIPDWDELKSRTHFKIGIAVSSYQAKDRYVSAISKPASSCRLSSLVILDDNNNSDNNDEGEETTNADEEKEKSNHDAKIKIWLAKNRPFGIDNENNSNHINIGWGQKGFQDLLKSDVDAVYVIVPPGTQRDYVLAALEAKKHVLLNDPVSTSLPEFTEQQVYAKKYGKFIQFTTMFLHQYKVRSFIDGVLSRENFGRIHTISSFVRLSFDDVEQVGVKFPLTPADGCIRVLGRFCVLMSTLFFSRVGSFAKSARVKFIHEGDIALSAECVVKYSEGRELVFDVGYTHSATRQSIEVHSDARYAAMKDFIIEHPDGLATYRLYEKDGDASKKLASTSSEDDNNNNNVNNNKTKSSDATKNNNSKNKKNDVDIKSGESIDMAGGPSQQMMMWRKFVDLSQSLDKNGGWDDRNCDATAECRELANVALQTKRILSALLKSGQNNCEEVVIDDIEYE